MKFVSGVCIGIGTIGLCSQITANTILPETDEEYEKEREEIEANMKIYACAPEMLKMLKNCLTSFNWVSENCLLPVIKNQEDADIQIHHIPYNIQELELLIEKVTTI